MALVFFYLFQELFVTLTITWMIVKQNVYQILVAPCDLQFVLLVERQNVFHPFEIAHPRQIHQHDARVDA